MIEFIFICMVAVIVTEFVFGFIDLLFSGELKLFNKVIFKAKH